MPPRAEFHPEANAEFGAAVDWYDPERLGLGTLFAASVRDAVRRAVDTPLMGAPTGKELRRLFVDRFPYPILYAVETERVFIVAVAHLRRHPDYWKRRR